METCLLRFRLLPDFQQNEPPPKETDPRGPGRNSRFRTDGGLSGMVVDLLEPTHGLQVRSSARRNRDGFPPVKAGYWKAAARRLQKARGTSVSSPGRKKEKCPVSKQKTSKRQKKDGQTWQNIKTLWRFGPPLIDVFSRSMKKCPNPKQAGRSSLANCSKCGLQVKGQRLTLLTVTPPNWICSGMKNKIYNLAQTGQKKCVVR